MLKIKCPRIKDLADLRNALQNAVELEHSTIPPYLTAMYSIKEGANREVAALIRSVVVEEMLHMTIAANVLNAVGGHPDINKPDFIPDYPTPLPMGIGSEEGLVVPIKKVSLELVKDIFMEIEEPEEPIEFPVGTALKSAAQPEYYNTIGEFYAAVKQQITALGNGIFTGDAGLQVTSWFPPDQLFPVTDVDSACRAIDIIVEQGEGTSISPLDPEGELAHYYKFAEIYHGKRLVADSSVEQGYSYSGAPILLDESGVYPMMDNPKTTSFPADSRARFLSDQFNYSYSKLLNALHITFNGKPGYLDESIGLMYSLKLQAQELVATPVGDTGENAGPTWEWVSVNA